MNAHAKASKLDTEKLLKLRALMERGATEGERAAARSRAEVLAAKAGLTLSAALSTLDATPAPQPSSFFAGFDDWMEAKEPGYKAREAVRRAEKEAKRRARCKELLALYGSVDAVFEPTPLEAALRDALEPLMDPANTLWGYRGFSFRAGPTPEMWVAMRAAVSMPSTVQEAWAAYQAKEELIEHRIAFSPDYTSWQWEDAWSSALEHLLDNLRDPSVEGISARLKWLEHRANHEMVPDPDQERALVASLQADFAAFVQSGQSAPQRPADRRATVLDLLRAGLALSDREIARRAGVSPQTVGNIRKRHTNQETAA
ncbi:helix-turn-helix domain-containing protein [Paracoccus aminophilus]|uniref:Homeodomain-like domain-containing protein n=1 Tax=Paracoccus aminophilus JCM 7686 TaxID=1367847 RepID=S5Y9T8_PARAH|nr:helix-turn-helix domain-containing protein [Paracoccus aminophilus]AGT08123.1 hypothetical protein JCM7686_1014 [Paracoccus aminophilus JCM 7686]